MAITFHEGLPGAGKSYESVLSFILPAVKAGRPVYSNIRGLNPDAIAQYLGIAPVFARSMIHTIEHDSRDADSRQLVEDFLLKAAPDSLIVWDEIQNFYPPSRQALSHRVTQFVTEHRHSGHDIILMGQDRRDVHPIWRRRIEQVITFRKLSYIGFDRGYRYTVYQSLPPDKWEAVTSGTRTYDKRVFSLYKSFRDETKNKALLKSEKTIFSSWGVRFGLPACVLAAGWGIWTAAEFFDPAARGLPPLDAPAGETAPAPVVYAGGGASAALVIPPPVVGLPSVVPPMPVNRPGTGPGEYLAALLGSTEAYVVGYVVSQEEPARWFGEVVFYDRSGQPTKRFGRLALADLGAEIEPREYGFLLRIPQGDFVVPYRVSPDRGYTPAGAMDRYRREAGITPIAPSIASGDGVMPAVAGSP